MNNRSRSGNSPLGPGAACLLICLTWALQGCIAGLWLAPLEEQAPVSYQLYLSQMQGRSVQFEQYRSLPSGLFVECGQIAQGQGKPREQGVVAVSAEQELLVREKFAALEEQGGPGGDFALSPPSGDDRVLLSFRVGERVSEIRTELGAIAKAETGSAPALRELLEAIRGLPTRAPCKTEVFAGIARESY